LHSTPGYFEASFFQTLLVDRSAVSVRMQWERHNAKPSVPKVPGVLGAGAGRRALFNSDKRDVREQELVDDDHR
jgi:hypothetical protein